MIPGFLNHRCPAGYGPGFSERPIPRREWFQVLRTIRAPEKIPGFDKELLIHIIGEI